MPRDVGGGERKPQSSLGSRRRKENWGESLYFGFHRKELAREAGRLRASLDHFNGQWGRGALAAWHPALIELGKMDSCPQGEKRRLGCGL